MRSFTAIAFVIASVLTGALAQDQTQQPPTAGPATHQILVGANGTLAFSPANITANIGDVVNFVFMSKNHVSPVPLQRVGRSLTENRFL